MPRKADIDLLTSLKVRRLNDWWHVPRPGRDMPDRDDFDPAAWKPLLPNILLAECSDPPFRVRFRLVGSGVAYVAGFDFTGSYLDEALSPDASEIWPDHYRRAFDCRAPVLGTATVATLGGEPFHYDFGIFPMTHGGSEIRQFIAIEDYGGLQPRVQSTLMDLTIGRNRSE